jgi:ABC-type glycerol-3-phosphate transport system substrate-binding protein
MNKRAITKLQGIILIVILLVAGIAGMLWLTAPTPTQPPPEKPPEEKPPAEKPPEQPPPTIEITAALWSGYPLIKTVNELASKFEQENPNIKIKVLPIDRFEMLGKYTTEFTGKTGAYDIVSILPSWLGTFEDHLLPLDDYLKANPGFGVDDFIPNIWQTYGIWKGQVIAIPVHPDPQVLYYRMDLFNDPDIKAQFKQKYGYELDLPKTWEQTIDIAEFFYESDVVEFGIVDQFTARGLPFTFQSIFSSVRRSPEAVKDLGEVNPLYLEFFTNDGKPAFDSKHGVRAANILMDLTKYTAKPLSSLSLDEAVGLFTSGRVAMMIGWTFIAPALKDPEKSKIHDVVGIAPMPGGAPYLGGFSLAVSKYSKNPDAAVKFLLYITSADSQLLGYKKYKLSPSRESVFSQLLKETEDPQLKVLLDTFRVGSPRPRIAGSEQLVEILGVYLEKMINGQLSVNDALEQAAREWRRVLGI